jgi:hypothetical protein
MTICYEWMATKQRGWYCGTRRVQKDEFNREVLRWTKWRKNSNTNLGTGACNEPASFIYWLYIRLFQTLSTSPGHERMFRVYVLALYHWAIQGLCSLDLMFIFLLFRAPLNGCVVLMEIHYRTYSGFKECLLC